jgi:hypothetical protein
VTRTVQLAGCDTQDDRFTSTCPHRVRGVLVGREMDVLSSARSQSLAEDAGNESWHGAVVERLGRRQRRQSQIDGDGVPLGGAYPAAVAWLCRST